MIQIIQPGYRRGFVTAPSSKSMAHRFLICAALGKEEVQIACPGISRDIEATMECLNGLGANIWQQDGIIHVKPIFAQNIERREGQIAVLPCQESGSTLRFLLPVAGALGMHAEFRMEGRLPNRPMAEFEAELERHGMQIRREGESLYCSGRLEPGEYELPGNISSQYFSGLLFALPLLSAPSRIRVQGNLESEDYLYLTEMVLDRAKIAYSKEGNHYRVSAKQCFQLPKNVQVEGDYSSAAFFLCAGAISKNQPEEDPKGITVSNLSPDSRQGDRRITEALAAFGARIEREGQQIKVQRAALKGICIDASRIPDLIPVLSVVASVSEGKTHVVHGERLRMKESDRIKSTVEMLTALGAQVEETEDGMIIHGKLSLSGGVVDPVKDHRIAMAAAVAACVCQKEVTVLDAECVGKSYPDFWEDFGQLSVTSPQEII